MRNSKIRKLLCVLLTGLFLLSLVGCSGQDKSQTKKQEGKENSAVQADEPKKASEDKSTGQVGSSPAAAKDKQAEEYTFENWADWGENWIRRQYMRGQLQLQKSEDPAGYSYYVLPDGTIYLNNLPEEIKEAEEVTIPEKVDGLTVSALTYRFPETLTKITLPESLKVIAGKETFADTALTEITLPAGLCSIGEKTFNRCKSLTKIELPDSLVHIGERAFSGSALTELILPEGLRIVEQGAFAGLKITSVKLPASLETIDKWCFQSCINLANIEFSPGLKTIGSFAFENCTALESVDFPEGLECIDSWAFSKSGLSGTLTLPASCSRFYAGCFANTALTEVHLQGDMTYVEGDFLGGILPDDCVLIDANGKERRNEDFYTKTEDGYGLYLLDDNRAGLYRLREEDLANEGVLELPAEVDGYEIVFLFLGYEDIIAEKIICPDTVRIIGESCFDSDTVTEIVLAEGIERIEYSAFSDCTALDRIELPAGLKYVDTWAFDINRLDEIHFAGSEEVWNQFGAVKYFNRSRENVTFGK